MKKLMAMIIFSIFSLFSITVLADVNSTATQNFINFTNKAVQADYTCTPQQVHDTDANFCQKFIASTGCSCWMNKLNVDKSNCYTDTPGGTVNMPWIYKQMESYGGIPVSCSIGHVVSTSNCIKNWQCYLDGSNKVAGCTAPPVGCPGHPGIS